LFKRTARRFHVYGESFREARLIAALTRVQAAVWLGVTVRTVRNWENDRTRVPFSAFKLLRVLSGYALPHDAWRGWCVRGDTLFSPEQKAFRPHDFNWWGLTVAMARAWRQRYGATRSSSWLGYRFRLRMSILTAPRLHLPNRFLWMFLGCLSGRFRRPALECLIFHMVKSRPVRERRAAPPRSGLPFNLCLEHLTENRGNVGRKDADN
jgi:hypothetical protein